MKNASTVPEEDMQGNRAISWQIPDGRQRRRWLNPAEMVDLDQADFLAANPLWHHVDQSITL